MKRFGLSSIERIKSRKDFENIYSFGKTLFSFDKKIRLVYLVEKADNRGGVKIATAVSKKLGNAVWRNRTKRILKSCFRLNKNEITEHCINNKILLRVVFSPYHLNGKKNKKIEQKEILPSLLDVLKKLKSALE
ncbi:MAG TPA: ribonuclease P protein component [Ignavibacteriaceae bacterium]|nr:ribonuclease P protein component [Ignavibacteriaceae bacterium]